MGTRHLTAIMKDNEYKVAQYGQWDGYPEGQGLQILHFLKNNFDKEDYLKKLDNVTFITEEELKGRWEECGADSNNQFVSMDVAQVFAETYPENSRDTGAAVLSIIQHANRPIKLTNSIDFAGDSLFCEWAYVIDFDQNALEVYSGYNKSPIDSSERFAFLQNDESEYSPVTLVAKFALDNLPTEEKFVNELTEKASE